MLTLSDCRRILGVTASGLSDEEIFGIRDAMREFAEIALETLAERARRNGNNYPPQPASACP